MITYIDDAFSITKRCVLSFIDINEAKISQGHYAHRRVKVDKPLINVNCKKREKYEILLHKLTNTNHTKAEKHYYMPRICFICKQRQGPPSQLCHDYDVIQN